MYITEIIDWLEEAQSDIEKALGDFVLYGQTSNRFYATKYNHLRNTSNHMVKAHKFLADAMSDVNEELEETKTPDNIIIFRKGE